MKKIVSFALIVSLALFCLSCGGKDPSDTTQNITPENPPTQETPIETPVETPIETPIETPAETPIETPAEAPEETPEETTAKGGFTVGEDDDTRGWSEFFPPM